MEEAKQLDHFICSEHASDEEFKKAQENSLTNGKVSKLVLGQKQFSFDPSDLVCLYVQNKLLHTWKLLLGSHCVDNQLDMFYSINTQVF